MAEEPKSPPTNTAAIPEATLTSRRRLSVIWIIPLIAAIIAGWLVYRSYAERGPQVEISFNSADGVEASKTKIKFKDVDVGTVNSVTISEDLSHIRITAEMVKGSENLLRENTRFWIVRPRVGVGGVSGLSTLVSGAYIAIDPGEGGERSEFTGIEEPPLIGSDVPGKSFVLKAPTLGSIARGAPIYYRGIEVGQVLGFELDEDARDLVVHIFVRSPHDALVSENTRFWNASGIRVVTSGSNIELDIASFQSILIGGIEFDTPVTSRTNDPAAEGHEFALYSNRQSVDQAEFARRVPFLTFFDGSLRGLKPNAPVEFRGIRVGTVTDISIRVDRADKTIRIPVALELEPGRLIAVSDTTEEDLTDEQIYRNMDDLVQRGLRAQLETANLLTGDLFVSLEFHQDLRTASLNMDDTHPVIPSIPTQLEALTEYIDSMLKQVSSLNFDELAQSINRSVTAIEGTLSGAETQQVVSNVTETIAELRTLLGALNSDLPPLMVDLRQAADAATSTLEQAQTTLGNANGMVSTESPLRYDLAQTLVELRGAARSIRVFADYLERNPDALIRGRGVSGR